MPHPGLHARPQAGVDEGCSPLCRLASGVLRAPALIRRVSNDAIGPYGVQCFGLPSPFDANPATLWTLYRHGREASCEVVFTPVGVEVRTLRNRLLLDSQVFASVAEATAHAEAERVQTMELGWTAAVSRQPSSP